MPFPALLPALWRRSFHDSDDKVHVRHFDSMNYDLKCAYDTAAIPELGTTGVVIMMMATVYMFVALRRKVVPTKKWARLQAISDEPLEIASARRSIPELIEIRSKSVWLGSVSNPLRSTPKHSHQGRLFGNLSDVGHRVLFIIVVASAKRGRI